ncbi:hypothetical protein [Arcobacter peruensis]|uniref:hypothetical protein n=1 Tax=Arcobacter peruensis TaxID=2320140 RepID=UPI000F076935|nr:hypothetical protein [Arcobacter peruensis]
MNNIFAYIQKLILGLLLICSVNILEASSSEQVAIGYNPADFTVVGMRYPDRALTDMVVTTLFQSRCSYIVTATEDPRVMEAINEEIELSNSDYIDPSNRVISNHIAATHLVKGNSVLKQGRLTVNLRIEDRQGNVVAQAKASGLHVGTNYWRLIEEASRSLAKQMCREPYYTVTTSQKTSTTAKVIENYRGINKDLKSHQEDKDTYYIYIDEDNAKIVQYHVDAKSTRKIHREKYELNMDSCQYEIEKEDKLIKNMGGQDILKSEDEGWWFEDDSKIYVNLPSSDKELSFTWGSLRKYGNYSNNKQYKDKIPEIAKQILGKVNDMATLFRKESKNSKEMEIFKNLYGYPGSPADVQCGGKVTMESFLIPPLDGLQDPDIDFSINIRLSNKDEIKILQKKMNIK